MLKHILVPTDGSTLSLRAAKHAIRLAKVHGARITAFYAAPEYHANIAGDYLVPVRKPLKRLPGAGRARFWRIEELREKMGCGAL